MEGVLTMPIPSPEERIGILEAGQKDLRTDVHEIKGDIRDMRTDLAGRPTWGVAKVLAFQAGLSATLGTALLMLLVNQ
jgi:hypothetical protein